jgi:hypothetical protein
MDQGVKGRALRAAGESMSRPTYIALHASAAAVFVFVLQTSVLHETTEKGLLWAAMFGLAAAGLAWHQSNR